MVNKIQWIPNWTLLEGARTFESDLVIVGVVDGEDSLVRRRVVLEKLDERGEHEHGRDPRLLGLRR